MPLSATGILYGRCWKHRLPLWGVEYTTPDRGSSITEWHLQNQGINLPGVGRAHYFKCLHNMPHRLKGQGASVQEVVSTINKHVNFAGRIAEQMSGPLSKPWPVAVSVCRAAYFVQTPLTLMSSDRVQHGRDWKTVNSGFVLWFSATGIVPGTQ